MFRDYEKAVRVALVNRNRFNSVFSRLTKRRIMDKQKFPPFSLTRLLNTVFAPKPGERVAILIDLADPAQVKDFAFLKDDKLTIQRKAYDVFYQGLKNGGLGRS